MVWANDVGASAKAVVVKRFGHTIAIGVKHGTGVRQTVPLGAVLQMHDDQVVAHHIGAQGVVAPHLVVHIGFAVAHRGAQHGRVAAGVKHRAAGKIQGQAQVKTQTVFDLGHALQHFGGGEQIHAAKLVIGAEVAPSRACGAVFPAGRCGHGGASSRCMTTWPHGEWKSL